MLPKKQVAMLPPFGRQIFAMFFFNKINTPSAPVIPCEASCLGTQNPFQNYLHQGFFCIREQAFQHFGFYD